MKFSQLQITYLSCMYLSLWAFFFFLASSTDQSFSLIFIFGVPDVLILFQVPI